MKSISILRQSFSELVCEYLERIAKASEGSLSYSPMTLLHINISDDLKARLEARARESGFDRLDEYIESLLEADTADEAIEDEALEELLLRRLDNPATVELTPAFVEQFKLQVAQRRSARKARP